MAHSFSAALNRRCGLVKEQETQAPGLASGSGFQFEQTSAIFGEYEDLNDAHAAAKC